MLYLRTDFPLKWDASRKDEADGPSLNHMTISDFERKGSTQS